MERRHKEYLFTAIVIFFVIAVALNPIEVNTEGQAAKQQQKANTPHVELISPGPQSTLHTKTQTFIYKPQSTTYEVNCTVLVNDQKVDTHQLSPGQQGVAKAELPLGYHTWKVQCDLLNERTISSPEWNFKVKTPESLEQNQNSFRQVTGQATDTDIQYDERGIYIALIIIGSFIWIAQIRKNN